MERTHWIGAGLALVAALAAGAWYARSAPQPPPLTVAAPPAADEPITVHVAGAVPFPGLVEVPRGARVADAVAAAGGALPEADLSALNLAAPLADGQRLLVGPTDAADAVLGGADGPGSRIHLNSASAADLERLPGVGPVLAERIVAHRENHGPFAAFEDLLDVPGIGEGKLAALREEVLVP